MLIDRLSEMLEGDDFSRIHTCAECGDLILSSYKRRVFCSAICRKLNSDKVRAAKNSTNLLTTMEATREIAWKNGYGSLSCQSLSKDAAAGLIPGHSKSSPEKPLLMSSDVLWAFLRSDRGFTYSDKYNPVAMFTDNGCNCCKKTVNNPDRFLVHEINCQRKKHVEKRTNQLGEIDV